MPVDVNVLSTAQMSSYCVIFSWSKYLPVNLSFCISYKGRYFHIFSIARKTSSFCYVFISWWNFCLVIVVMMQSKQANCCHDFQEIKRHRGELRPLPECFGNVRSNEIPAPKTGCSVTSDLRSAPLPPEGWPHPDISEMPSGWMRLRPPSPRCSCFRTWNCCWCWSAVIYGATNAALAPAARSPFVILSGVFFWVQIFVRWAPAAIPRFSGTFCFPLVFFPLFVFNTAIT